MGGIKSMYPWNTNCRLAHTTGKEKQAQCHADWAIALARCLHRIQLWRSPPGWSIRDWLDEITCHAAAAAWRAHCDYNLSRGVPFAAFAYKRVLGSALTRYREEWRYGLRRMPDPNDKRAIERDCSNISSPDISDFTYDLRWALSELPKQDQAFIEILFWQCLTETEIAQELGITQQAVSKRKRAVLCGLRRLLEEKKLKRSGCRNGTCRSSDIKGFIG